MAITAKVLDHGYVTLTNIAGPTRRAENDYDADDTDPANAARFSLDGANQERAREQDLKLADYLLKNLHTTPFEMVTVWLEMQMPIFVARQFVRHRNCAINEISARYVQLPDVFYIPELKNIGTKAKNNKQGREISENLVTSTGLAFRKTLSQSSESCYSNYQFAIDTGIPNELARCFLPVNIYTKWLWKQDLWNMMHFLKLRMHDHAQFEAREYANAIYQLLRGVLPETMKIFDKYIRQESGRNAVQSERLALAEQLIGHMTEDKTLFSYLPEKTLSLLDKFHNY